MRRPRVLPELEGRPIQVVLSPQGSQWAASSIPRRIIYLDPEVLVQRGEFERILIHEIFHFAWVRLSNQARWDWEAVLRAEIEACAVGELGWSAERRKLKLTRAQMRSRGSMWRIYACESFCDTGAWMYSGLRKHEEFTLHRRAAWRRQRWFEKAFSGAIRI
ncbi:MAG: hypothetical protein ABI824_13100 [Acidobacteriota bacterium]